MLALVGRRGGLATVLGLAGLASLVAAVVLAPIGSAGTRYRRRRLTRTEPPRRRTLAARCWPV